MPQEYLIEDMFNDGSIEQSVLKSISEDTNAYQEVSSIMSPEIFYVHSELAESVITAIKNKTEVPCINSPKAVDLFACVNELRELYKKRSLAVMLTNTVYDLKDSKSAVSQLANLKSSIKELDKVFYGTNTNSLASLKSMASQIVTDIELRIETRRKTGSTHMGLPTGFKGLDDLLGGLQSGLHLLAAPPGLGKTTFSINIGRHVAQKGCPVIFVTFEELPSRLGFKVISMNSGLEAKKYYDGYGDLRDLNKAISDSEILLKNFYFIEGTSALQISDIEEKISQLLSENEQTKCLIIIDYLQRMAACNTGFTDYRMSVSNLVAEMRQMSMMLNSPVLVISSQNRIGQGGAKLTSLKESGDLEYAADSVIFLTEDRERSLMPPGRSVSAIVEKNRFGDRGVVDLVFRPDLGLFREEARSNEK